MTQVNFDVLGERQVSRMLSRTTDKIKSISGDKPSSLQYQLYSPLQGDMRWHIALVARSPWADQQSLQWRINTSQEPLGSLAKTTAQDDSTAAHSCSLGKIEEVPTQRRWLPMATPRVPCFPAKKRTCIQSNLREQYHS